MTQKTKNILTICAVSVTVAITAILCISTFSYNGGDECKAVIVEITDIGQRQYTSENSVLQHIRQQGLNPVGKIFDSINCGRIEQSVAAYEPVRTAECYKTSGGEIHIRITQRQPLVRVITATDSYFVDSDRRTMSILPSIRTDVLIAEGSIGTQMAKNEIADFAEWLQKNDYWRGRITRIAVRSDKNITAFQHSGEPCIVLGKIIGYKKKLKRLRTFMEAGSEMDIKSYKELDVSIDGQVIGRN